MTETNPLYVCSNSIYVRFVDAIDAGVSQVDIRNPNSHNQALAAPPREAGRSNGDRVDAE